MKEDKNIIWASMSQDFYGNSEGREYYICEQSFRTKKGLL